MSPDLAALPPVLSTTEAAAVLRVSVTKVKRMVTAGALPRLNYCRDHRIPTAAVLALIGMTPATEPEP